VTGTSLGTTSITVTSGGWGGADACSFLHPNKINVMNKHTAAIGRNPKTLFRRINPIGNSSRFNFSA
jgi:hypothetical protein